MAVLTPAQARRADCCQTWKMVAVAALVAAVVSLVVALLAHELSGVGAPWPDGPTARLNDSHRRPPHVSGFTWLHTEQFRSGDQVMDVEVYWCDRFGEIVLPADDSMSIACEFVLVPGGTFVMGSDNDFEGPPHRVTVRSFLMARTELPQKVWEAIVGTNPAKRVGMNAPVEPWSPVQHISWDDTCQKGGFLDLADVPGLRLPSEAEWEYACRAGTSTAYSVGEFLKSADAVFSLAPDHGFIAPARVGSFPCNAFGLFDMHGNVGEWCEDFVNKDYRGAPTDGRAWLASPSQDRVYRGGCFSDPAEHCRSATRFALPASRRTVMVGVRLACSVGH